MQPWRLLSVIIIKFSFPGIFLILVSKLKTMALFEKSGNPALQEKTFQGTIFEGVVTGQEMTVKGTINRFGILMAFMMASALFAWNQFYKGSDPTVYLVSGTFGIFIVSLVMYFKKQWSPFLAPAHAIITGLFVGSVSAMYDYKFKTNYPGLVMQAVMLTMAVAVAMFVLYYTRLIKVTEKFKSVIIIATSAIMIFYLVKAVFYWIFNIPIAGFTSASTPLGIGFSIVVVVLAALNLLLDFDMIENGASNRVPKYMEWFCASALVFTLIWLYLEMLRLLAKLRNN